MTFALRIDGETVGLAEARRILAVPPEECFGCFLVDAAPDAHDVLDSCEYLGGYVLDLSDEKES